MRWLDYVVSTATVITAQRSTEIVGTAGFVECQIKSDPTQEPTMRNHNLKLERRSPATTPEGRTMLGAGGIVGIVALLALKIFGFNALLPILAAMLVAAGFAIAAIAWVSGARRHDSEVTSWDIAGVLAFLGFAAAMIAV